MRKTLRVHPDALYDSLYIDHEIDTDDYEKPVFEFKGEYKHEKGVTIITKKGHGIVIENCFDNTIRLRITQVGLSIGETVTERLGLINTAWQPLAYDYKCEDGFITFSNASLALLFDMNTGDFEFRSVSGKVLLKTKNGGVKLSKTPAEYSGMKTYTEFERIENERYCGFGGRIFKMDRTGESADIFSEKAGWNEGDYGGFPMPYFISSRGYGFFFNNPWPHVYFDMAKTNENEWFLSSPGGDYDIFVFAGCASNIIQSFTKIVGTNQFPKKWLMGFWCSCLSFISAQAAIDDMQRMRREGYPCEAIVIDGPWRGGANFVRDYSSGWGYPSDDYNWHPDFGDGVGMIETLKEDNIKTVLHINSCAYKPSTAISGIAQGLLRQVGSETVPDVATERGIEFYKTFLVPRIKDGVTQWWTDHSDRLSGEILPGVPSRNLFGPMWNRAISDIMAENGVQGHMALSRGGGIGSQKYALPWSGDTEFGINRFKEDIWYIINAGMAGFTLCGYDLGGFSGGKDRETANAMQFNVDNFGRRFCQSIIFSPMPRMHNSEKSKAKWPWNCTEEMSGLYKDCLTFRYRFTPTLYSYAINGSKCGEPIIRPMFYNDVENTKLYDIDDQFYIGDYVLVAPIVEAGATKREVYLTAGRWVNLWTKERFCGEQVVECEAPMYKKEGLPMFVKVGGGIAYQPDCMSLYDSVPEELFIELYADTSAEISLHEGECVTNKFSCNKAVDGFEVFAENNSDTDRKYVITIFAEDKNYQSQFTIKAKSVKNLQVK